MVPLVMTKCDHVYNSNIALCYKWYRNPAKMVYEWFQVKNELVSFKENEIVSRAKKRRLWGTILNNKLQPLCLPVKQAERSRKQDAGSTGFRATIPCSHLIGQNSVTWLALAAREPGKGRLSLSFVGRGEARILFTQWYISSTLT